MSAIWVKMRREIGPEATVAFEAAVRDAEAAVAYADAIEEAPSGPKPPSWWQGDEEASDLAVGWAARASSVSGINV